MATYTPTRLGQAVLTTSPVDLFTASAATVLMQVNCANNTSSTATVRVALIPSGGTADGSNLLLPDVTVPAHDVVVVDYWQVMAAGDKLNCLSTPGAAVILTASGLVIT